MSKSIVAVAMAAALVGCATAPAGADRAQWRQDRHECNRLAGDKAEAGSSNLYLWTVGHDWWSPYVTSDDHPASAKSRSAEFNRCMVAKGYPPE